jgi:hypothetical protein
VLRITSNLQSVCQFTTAVVRSVSLCSSFGSIPMELHRENITVRRTGSCSAWASLASRSRHRFGMSVPRDVVSAGGSIMNASAVVEEMDGISGVDGAEHDQMTRRLHAQAADAGPE